MKLINKCYKSRDGKTVCPNIMSSIWILSDNLLRVNFDFIMLSSSWWIIVIYQLPTRVFVELFIAFSQMMPKLRLSSPSNLSV